MSREEQLQPKVMPSAPIEPSDDDVQLQINLRLHLDEIAEVEAKQLRSSARRRPTRQELCQLACRIYDARRCRDRIINREVFGEPAWDMLLALYCLPARGEILTVTALTLAANIPTTTGLRWQKVMTEEGLIERGPNGVDRRKQMIRLTKEGRTLMDKYLTRLFFCYTPVPEWSSAAGG